MPTQVYCIMRMHQQSCSKRFVLVASMNRAPQTVEQLLKLIVHLFKNSDIPLGAFFEQLPGMCRVCDFLDKKNREMPWIAQPSLCFLSSTPKRRSRTRNVRPQARSLSAAASPTRAQERGPSARGTAHRGRPEGGDTHHDEVRAPYGEAVARALREPVQRQHSVVRLGLPWATGARKLHP